MSAAVNYAEALFSLSEEMRASERVLSDVNMTNKVLCENPDYFKLTDTPAISVPEKLSLIERAFAGIDATVKNLLKILCEKHSVHIFPEIAKEFTAIYNEAYGICPAEVISAKALSAEDIARIKEKLERMTGKTIVIKNTIDQSLLGGIKLRYMGRELDGTLKARLTRIEQNLKNTIV